MRMPASSTFLSASALGWLKKRFHQTLGLFVALLCCTVAAMIYNYHPYDNSWNTAGDIIHNPFGPMGAIIADTLLQFLGLAIIPFLLIPLVWSSYMIFGRSMKYGFIRLLSGFLAPFMVIVPLGLFASDSPYFVTHNLGGALGEILNHYFYILWGPFASLAAIGFLGVFCLLLSFALAINMGFWMGLAHYFYMSFKFLGQALIHPFTKNTNTSLEKSPSVNLSPNLSTSSLEKSLKEETSRKRPSFLQESLTSFDKADTFGAKDTSPFFLKKSEDQDIQPASLEENFEEPVRRKSFRTAQKMVLDSVNNGGYELPSIDLLEPPKPLKPQSHMSREALEEGASQLEMVLEEFGVRGEIVNVLPGPVVTLYELKPAAGIKTSRVIGLADDIARSMSALSARIAVIPGRNVIGIELPNPVRETVFLRELLLSQDYQENDAKLGLVLGKDIGGKPAIADLTRMPHLLVAGTTGSGKSVSVNTMILSILFRLPPDKCKFIMIDPKMLELSVYDGIPHLLCPVVTNPKKAVVALKWAVREMESRYRGMAKLGVRNIDGYNARLEEARNSGEVLIRRVQTGFDPDTGKPIFENQPLDANPLPYIIVVVDEMADLMLVAGKEIESAVQRLAQMARAAGIHLIMATQRPSVDVITGTIKANFPTRISFQVTSKIDSRTILGEQGAEQLLGQGDMLYMVGGGRILRVHGPYVRDEEVEDVVRFLKMQGEPTYIESITEDEEASATFGESDNNEGDVLYQQALELVQREGKASTSFIQRHLQIGYNRAARIVDLMEKEGIISPANHVGKREVLGGRI